MTLHYADNQTYESREKATGREYLFREVCGAVALPTGEGGTVCGRSVRTNGHSDTYSVWLGSGLFRTPIRYFANFSRIIRHKAPHSFARKIIFGILLKIGNTPYCLFQAMRYTISRPVRQVFSNTKNSRFLHVCCSCTLVDWTSKQKRVFHVPNPLTRKSPWKKH